MATILYAGIDAQAVDDSPNVTLEDDGYYWQLYRYFEEAKIDHSGQLIDLYGGRKIKTYELTRLKHELTTALNDFAWRGDRWKFQSGWHQDIAQQNEIWHDTDATKMSNLIHCLIELIDYCLKNHYELWVDGD